MAEMDFSVGMPGLAVISGPLRLLVQQFWTHTLMLSQKARPV